MNSSRKYFGTDGIRGNVGKFPITADFVLKLGWAIGKVLSTESEPKVLIGKDTRISGYMIESALQAGLSAAGANIYLTGPMPTAAISYLTRTLRAHIGIVISASHNPYDDNGIKFFSHEGLKLSDKLELEIEHWIEQPIETARSEALGKAWRVDDAAGRYIEFCKSSVPHSVNLKNLKIVLDCANGATYHIAPHVFSELGADVINTNSSPNGININQNCGSNNPTIIQQRVLEEKADVGIAFDGDGDRVVMIDHQGEILDGDEIIYVILKNLLATHHFTGGVVGTSMSNLGLEVALKKLGVPFCRVPVGDQHVIRGMIDKDWQLGGESSGHIIYRHATTTGDGIIAALQVLQAMQVSGKNLHVLKSEMKKFPQRLINISYAGERVELDNTDIVNAISDSEKKLGKYGRVLLRYSGTEPVLRVMVEGEDEVTVDKVAETLSQTVSQFI